MTDKGDAISRAALERSIRDYADRVGPVRGEYELANGILKALTMVEQAPTIEPQVVHVEEWKWVAGYEGLYWVSSQGRVMNAKGMMMKQRPKPSNFTEYKKVSLWKDGKYGHFYVHQLVAKAFVSNPNLWTVVNHIDENGSNNTAENLEWCSKSYNRVYGNAIENHAKQIRGVPHSAEHKRKISDGLKRYYRKHGARMGAGEEST